MRIVIAIVLALSLAACREDRKPDLPGTGHVVETKVVEVVRYVYVPIPSSITRPEPIAEGPITEAFEVARQRRAALERANAKLREIAAIQGTEVEP